MTTADQGIHDQLARLRLKILEKKLDHEKDDLHSDRLSPSLDSEDDFLKLHTALLRRRQLLETLKAERRRNEDLERPRSLPFAAKRHHSPTRAHSQYSLPDVSQPYAHHRLDPIAHPPQLPNAPIYIYQQPPPPVAPAAPVNHIAPMYPLNVMPPPAPVSKESFNKSDVFEMMMMQNAQMHQLIMQQMMISALPMNPHHNSTNSNQRAGNSAEEPSAHHHHYYTNPRPAEVAYSQPVMPSYVRGSELPPLQAPKARRRTPPMSQPKRRSNRRKLRPFRKAAFAIIFVKMLRKGGQTLKVNPTNSFRLEILLKEAVGALHFLYLKQEWIAHPILMSIAGPNPFNFAAALDSNQDAIQRLSETLKNLLYAISRIMPYEGVLGTNRKSAFFAMTVSGQKFPGWYFWNIEKQLLSVDPHYKTTHVGKFETQVLLVGIVVGRALVTTMLLKPYEYGLTRSPAAAAALQQDNLKLVSTLLVYLLRKVYTRPGEKLGPIPEEVVLHVHNDATMSRLFSAMKRTLNYCEGILRAWTEDYYQRLTALKSIR